jgi:uncharacterized protein involved in response to NO
MALASLTGQRYATSSTRSLLALKDRDDDSGDTNAMTQIITDTITTSRSPVPRGIATSGIPLLSYGFRPFFLLAGVIALLAMIGWIGALTLGWEIGGSQGALNWHAHEMLFGYTCAALAGFLLTAIPNWTGRLPVAGMGLLGLVILWCAGRLAMAWPDAIGPVPAAIVDAAFLPTMAAIAGREIFAGKNWKNLKILVGLVALSLANVAFHASTILSGSALEASRATVGIYVVLIAVVGGRIVPSFTRNWLARAGSYQLPKPFSRFDLVSIIALGIACGAWAIGDETVVAAVLAFVAAALQAVRLWRWQGWRTAEEPLLLVLHVGYAFIPLGLFCVGLSELGMLSPPSALHVLAVGAIGVMTFAVMTRASLGHTGRPLTASPAISLAYLALVITATVRPFAELLPSQYHLLLGIAGTAWIVAFGLFLLEYGPILCGPSAGSKKAGVPAARR